MGEDLTGLEQGWDRGRIACRVECVHVRGGFWRMRIMEA